MSESQRNQVPPYNKELGTVELLWSSTIMNNIGENYLAPPLTPKQIHQHHALKVSLWQIYTRGPVTRHTDDSVNPSFTRSVL